MWQKDMRALQNTVYFFPIKFLMQQKVHKKSMTTIKIYIFCLSKNLLADLVKFPANQQVLTSFYRSNLKSFVFDEKLIKVLKRYRLFEI